MKENEKECVSPGRRNFIGDCLKKRGKLIEKED